jgi:hypothetical protein
MTPQALLDRDDAESCFGRWLTAEGDGREAAKCRDLFKFVTCCGAALYAAAIAMKW